MPVNIRYGVDSTFELDVAPSALLGPNPSAVNASQGVVEQVVSALAQPLDFPPLVQAIVPGDAVAVAVEPDVADAPLVVAGVVAALTEAGVLARQISIVLAPADSTNLEAVAEALPADVREEITIDLHDPNSRGSLRFLAHTKSGQGVYLNYRIVDADFVIPVGSARLDPPHGPQALPGGIYPTFSNAATHKRFQVGFWQESADRRRKELKTEVEEAAWLAGLLMGVWVIPGPQGRAAAVVAGALAQGQKLAHRRAAEFWLHKLPQRVPLVVAPVTGSQAQSWEAVGRALSAAAEIVSPRGSIVICSDLALPPGVSLKLLSELEDTTEAARVIRKHLPENSLPALQSIHAIEQAKVYLLSKLDESTVEEVGMIAITSPAEVSRLAHRQGECAVLADAQHALALVAGD